jgi:mannan endo-1,4-beta-mannosidase
MRRTWRSMRIPVFAAVAILLALRLGTLPFSSARAATAVSSDFVTRQGSNLILNGQTYRFTGINMYTANLRNDCVSGYNEGYNDSVLDNDLTQYDNATGGKSRVIRAWFFQSLATTNGVRDWSAFDHTLAVAQSHGFRVIAVLANGWGACEAPGVWGSSGTGYRDISFYQGGYKQAPDIGHPGGPSEGGITSYRQWVQDVVSRYADNPTIFAWQLMNEASAATYEPDVGTHFPCPNESAAYHALFSWATDMTALVKSIDPNHLVNIGTLDNSCGAEGSQNIAISSIAGNGFCDYHDYSAPGTAVPPDLSYLITACKRIGRPVIVDEMGVNLSDPTVNGNLTTRADDISAKMAAEFSAGVAGILPWVWNGSSQSIDRKYQIEPGDPVLAVLAQFGMSPPAPAPSPTASSSPSSTATAPDTAPPTQAPTPADSPSNSSQKAPVNTSMPPIINPRVGAGQTASGSTWATTALVDTVVRIVRAVCATLSRL